MRQIYMVCGTRTIKARAVNHQNFDHVSFFGKLILSCRFIVPASNADRIGKNLVQKQTLLRQEDFRYHVYRWLWSVRMRSKAGSTFDDS